MRPVSIISAILATFIILASFACEGGSGKWAAKIDGDVISIKELNSFYYTQNKILTNLEKNEDIDKLATDPRYAANPYLNKGRFLEQLISQKLLYKKAMSDSDVNKDELKTLVELTKLQTVSQYYLGKKLKDRIVVTDEEVNKFYSANKKRFAGRTANEATMMIKQQIFSYKSRQEANKYLMELTAQSKVNKEGFAEYMKEQAKKSAPKSEPKKEEQEKKAEK